MPTDISLLFIELGVVIVGLAVIARLSSSLGFSTIPLYLLAGLAFGKGGLAPLPLSQDFIHVGAEFGVLLLLFMLGLEYTGDELKQQLQTGLPSGVVDLALNFSARRDRRVSLGMESSRRSSVGRRHLYIVFRSDRQDPGGLGPFEQSRNPRCHVRTGA